MTPTRGPATSKRRFAPFRFLRAHYRLFACAIIGAFVGLALPDAIFEPPNWPGSAALELGDVTRGLIGWNVAVLLYLFAAALTIIGATHERIRARAQIADEGRGIVLFLAMTAAFVAIGAIIEELGLVKSLSGEQQWLHVFLAVATVVDSWLFMHLVFAFHYAHEYYLEQDTLSEKRFRERGGLIFPGEIAPLYPDFLYFAYVIGVAGQTADVSTSSSTMRKLALIQGVLAFFYNTTILALAVNIASGLV